MSLEPNFAPPPQSVSEAETAKREELILWFSELIDDAVLGFIVSGSMGYGANYSVKEASDIDMQLLVTQESVQMLAKLDVFDKNQLEYAIEGYIKGLFGQFSLVFEKNGVSMECHFWDLQAFIYAISYKTRETKRLRSGIDTPSTDHGFSFARDESVKDYYGEMDGEFAIGVFPSYRVENEILYLCRPITNILGLPKIVKTNDELNAAIDKTWQETINRLASHAAEGTLDLSKFNIENTLPGKNKMRQDIIETIRQKTKLNLAEAQIAYED